MDLKKTSILRDWERDLLGPPPSTPQFVDTKRILSSVVSAPEYSLADDYGWIHGTPFSLDVLLPQLTKVDLGKLGFDFRGPIFQFPVTVGPLGRPSPTAQTLACA
jgi:hypothetical protein